MRLDSLQWSVYLWDMLSVEVTAKVGGLFALLTLLHFVADWVFQSHAEAMAKTRDSLVRAKHCLIYTAILTVAIWAALAPSRGVLAVTAFTLWFSHLIEDTYLPVYVWGKYIRKPLELQEGQDPLLGFQAFASTALGKILLITLDQLVHLIFLLPICVMLVCPQTFYLASSVAFFGVAGLVAVAYVGKKDLG